MAYASKSERVRKLENEISEAKENMVKETNKVKSETFTMMGLLSAVMAFIIIGLDSVTTRDTEESLFVLLLMAGVILTVFGSFAKLFRSQYDESRDRQSSFIIWIGAIISTVAVVSFLVLR